MSSKERPLQYSTSWQPPLIKGLQQANKPLNQRMTRRFFWLTPSMWVFFHQKLLKYKASQARLMKGGK
ncbi:hypothetical protein BJP41_08640 [Candidatus Williamhamiltonella defendens]|uniref:Uncharacterized protein n=1 Tax=Candidatus Williamhamiltonella defendens TaxID=138072 RepID=A0A2D3T3I1_9ENTR|nr:hypothetical protein CJJ18_08470 [Candidatus Hamiltonella defensa]ATW30372.1 hypothetical protein BJP41_08640 [Candidatus Hamiltonella defensa]AWK16959.1 hypothetical protein CCS40_08285 [Candidatus Hamiltonella defensa]